MGQDAVDELGGQLTHPRENAKQRDVGLMTVVRNRAPVLTSMENDELARLCPGIYQGDAMRGVSQEAFVRGLGFPPNGRP